MVARGVRCVGGHPVLRSRSGPRGGGGRARVGVARRGRTLSGRLTRNRARKLGGCGPGGERDPGGAEPEDEPERETEDGGGAVRADAWSRSLRHLEHGGRMIQSTACRLHFFAF